MPLTIAPMEESKSPLSYPKRLLRRLIAAYKSFNSHGGLMLAAAMAYYLALSFFPLLLVLVAGLGVALESTAVGQDARQQLLTAIEQQASPQLAQQVGKALSVTSDQALASGPIGFAGLVVTAIMIFSQVDRAFNRIWKTEDSPNEGWMKWLGRLAFQRFKALVMLVAAGAFVLLATFASLVWSGVQAAVEPAIEVGPVFNSVFQFFIYVGLNFVAFTIIYRFVPKVPIRWSAALRGACVAAIMWEIGRIVLAYYLVRKGFPSAYGVIGSFLAIMLWAYYAMIVLFFGAEYARVANDEAGEALG